MSRAQIHAATVPRPSSVVIEELCAGDEPVWDQFVQSSPSGTFFHLTAWRQVIGNILGRQCFYLMARRNGHVTGVFPIGLIRSRVFGNSLVSLPLCSYGGICADDEGSYFALLDAGKALSERLGVKYLEMRNRAEPFATHLPGRELYVSFSQDLSPGPERLLERLPKKTRYEIRIGQKAGLEWTEGDDLGEFYEIYAHNVHRLGTPVFSRDLFYQLRRAFPGAWRLFFVRKQQKAIATAFCWYFRGTVMPFYVGSLKEHYKDSPNNFMYWKLIEQSCREGCSRFDFGRSKIGTGAFRFKCTWSMEETPLPYRYALSRTGEVPQLSPVDPKFRTVVEVWKRIPFALTKIVGPPLIRVIPSV